MNKLLIALGMALSFSAGSLITGYTHKTVENSRSNSIENGITGHTGFGKWQYVLRGQDGFPYAQYRICTNCGFVESKMIDAPELKRVY